MILLKAVLIGSLIIINIYKLRGEKLACNSGSYLNKDNICEECPEDTIGVASNLDRCEKCPMNSSTFGSTGSEYIKDCICMKGYYRLEQTTSCVYCPKSDRYICPGNINADFCVENEHLSKKGWWSTSLDSGIFIKCPNEDSCLPNCLGCEIGYLGPLCNTCADNYFPIEFGLKKKCIKCLNEYLLFTILGGIFLVLLTISYGIARVSELSCKYTILSRKYSMAIPKLKNLLFFLSISTTYGNFIRYSENEYQDMQPFFLIYLKVLKLLARNLWLPIDAFPSKCILKLFPITLKSLGEIDTTDAKSDLTVAIFSPIIGIFLLFVLFTIKHIIDVTEIYKENDKNEYNKMKITDSSTRLEKFHEILKKQTEKSTYRFISTCQVFLTLIYTPICWCVANSITCSTIPSYGSVQSESYILPCGTLKNYAIFGYIYFMFIFPFINIISSFFIKKKIIRRNQLYSISSGFLFSGYNMSVLFWESIRFYMISGIIQIMNYKYIKSRDLIFFSLSMYLMIIFIESIISPIDKSDQNEKYGMDKPWWIFSTSLFIDNLIMEISLISILCLLCIHTFYPNYYYIYSISILVIHIGTTIFLLQQVTVDTICLIYKYSKYKQLYGVKEQLLDTTESNDGMSLYYKHKLGDNEQANFMLGLLKSPFPDEAAAQMLYIIEQGNLFDCEAKDIGKLLFFAGFYEPQGQTIRYLIPKIKSYRSNSDIPVDNEIELLSEVRKCLMNSIRILGIESTVKNAQFRAKGAKVIFSSQQFGESTLLKTSSDNLFKFLSDVRCSNLSENKMQQKNFRLIFPDALPMVYPDDEEFRIRIIDARKIAKEIRSEREKKLKELQANNIYDKVFGFNIPIRPDVKELLEMKRLNELILPPRWDPLDGRLDHEFDHSRYIKIRKQFEDILPIAGTTIISPEEVERSFMKWYNEGLSIESSKRYDHTTMVGSKYTIEGESEIHDYSFQSRNGKSMMIVNNRQQKNKQNKNKN